MRTARWLVIATALVAAGAAFHLLMSPRGGSRSGSPGAAGRSGSSASDGPSSSTPPSRGERPLDEIDAESREAMRNFLRESAKDGE